MYHPKKVDACSRIPYSFICIKYTRYWKYWTLPRQLFLLYGLNTGIKSNSDWIMTGWNLTFLCFLRSYHFWIQKSTPRTCQFSRILLNICNGVSSQKQQMVFIHQLFPQKGFIFYRVLNMFLFLTATLCENGKKLTYLDFCWILYESDCYTYSNKNWENQLFRIHSKGTLHPLHYICIFLRGVTALRLT